VLAPPPPPPPPLWRHVNAAGLRCGIVNVPLTYPPERINGFMLAGQDAPGPHRSLAEPRELYDELIARFGRYPLKEIFPGGRQKSDYLTLFDRDTRERGAILEALAARDDWDFLLAFSSASAMAQHYFWADMASGDPDNPYRPLIKSVFVALDTVIGRMIELEYVLQRTRIDLTDLGIDQTEKCVLSVRIDVPRARIYGSGDFGRYWSGLAYERPSRLY
jgi:predicted AlkP superfamily phosphohydrolase/phosphomutase